MSVRDASLHRRLLARLIPALFVAIAVGGVTSYFVARRSADFAYDQALVAAAADIAGGVHVDGGRVAFDLSPQSERILRSDERDNIYFSVRSADGTFLGGDRDLVGTPVDGDEDVSHDLPFRAQVLRSLSLGFDEAAVPFVVTVAETTRKRQAAAWRVFAQMVLPTTLVLSLAGLIVWLSVRAGLQPLDDLQREIERKSEFDLSPIPSARTPFEVRSLVRTLNLLLARLDAATRMHQAFVADAAHQLRTPLAGIHTQVELLSTAVDIDQEPTLRQLRVSVNRAIRLVNQLLALARSDRDANALRLEEFDLATVIGEAADGWVHRAITGRVDLGFELAPSRLRGDPYLLRELLENVVDNALRHAPPGGSITVSTRSDGQRVDVAVDDSGPGIPASLTERVFERFYRQDECDGTGSGLGLAIVRQIALRHGGAVEARTSAMLGGLRLLVRLPVTGPSEAPVSESLEDGAALAEATAA